MGLRQDVGIDSSDLQILNFRHRIEMLEGKKTGKDVLETCNIWEC